MLSVCVGPTRALGVEQMNATALVEAVQRGDREARETLFRTWTPIVRRWCARLGGPTVDAEDAAHDAFLIVLTRIDSLLHPACFERWLFGITRRVLARHRRRAWARRWVQGPIPEAIEVEHLPDRDAEKSDTLRALHIALQSLPAPQREVLLLSDLEDRPAPEVAIMIRAPIGTVASRLRLARAKLAKALAA